MFKVSAALVVAEPDVGIRLVLNDWASICAPYIYIPEEGMSSTQIPWLDIVLSSTNSNLCHCVVTFKVFCVTVFWGSFSITLTFPVTLFIYIERLTTPETVTESKIPVVPLPINLVAL